MNADSLQLQAIEDKILALDTLIASQQSKIESLSIIVHDNNIAEGFFSSILSSQLQTFSIIVAALFTLIGIVSWGSVKLTISNLKRKINKKIDDIETKVNTITEKSNEHEYGLNINYALIARRAKTFLEASLWFLRASNSEGIKESVKDINFCLSKALEDLSKEQTETCDESIINEANELLQNLIKIDGVDKKTFRSIRQRINSMDPLDKDTAQPDKGLVEL